jgi:ribosomal protein S20
VRTLRNKRVKSRLRTEENKFDHMVEHGELTAAQAQLSLLTKLFQRAADRRIVEANRAARKQAQFQERLNALQASAAK